MWIGYLEIELHLPGVDSLKGKRMILKSIKDRVHSRYNVGIAEIEGNEKWQKAVLGIVGIYNSRQKINSLLDNIVNWFENLREIDIINYNYRFL